MRPTTLRSAAAVAAALALGACAKDPELRLTAPAANLAAPFLERYVAIGNSITAGYQSGGINDSTQQRAFPVLLARAAGVDFTYPALAKPGCPAPIADFLTGARVAASAGQTVAAAGCYGRQASAQGRPVDNVAVPGANSFDPVGTVQGSGASALTAFILGGRTQVQAALERRPTFVSVWIGNNDVLSFALAGTRAGVTDSAAFVANYQRMLSELLAGAPGLKGVLIGVVNVTNAPLAFPLSVINPAATPSQPAFAYNAQAAAAVQQLLGRPIAFAPNCNTGAPQLAFTALSQIAAAANAVLPAGAPFPFVCADIPGVVAKTPGVLSEADRQFFVNRVRGWNAFLRAKADSIGFAFYDPNSRLDAWRASGQVPPFPNLAARTAPFAPYVSNDGVHPSTAAHVVLAGDLAAVINQKYGSSLPTTIAAP
ncbi:SGNH/GDSL hydrolase family protein [Roseisolibacter sp. H3M3-2]|uniref:SGNH/GDSL hydrolase family protein n=1 Tax=Roseisolibacter sp. H3M3-2 TaxID=3031323 RepID=UPI0023D9C3F9|nr:SGNH/GDSL hydrolase family protein [Roseisolibacter sp. H3M3-2]MDF1504202.1 SGNH/GDSL hydrolase family protein [Roseisolibacter sp. H3M3-2]